MGHKKVLSGWIKQRIKKNKNVIIVINGATGSGKSFAALTIAYDVSKILGTNFSVKDNVDFNFTGLLKKTTLPKNTKAGTPFIFEEVGAIGGGASAREWQSRVNRFFFSFLQTTRHRNQILIFTCPHFSFLDSGARILVHLQIIMQGIDFKKNIAHTKPYVLQVNQRTGKIYFKMLRYRVDDVRYKLIDQRIRKPSKELIKEYEDMKFKYTSKLNQSIIDDELREEENRRRKTQRKQFNEDNKEHISSLLDKGYNTKTISDMLKISQRTVQIHKKRRENE